MLQWDFGTFIHKLLWNKLRQTIGWCWSYGVQMDKNWHMPKRTEISQFISWRMTVLSSWKDIVNGWHHWYGSPCIWMKTQIESYLHLKTTLFGYGMPTMEHVKDHSEIIQSASLKYCGAAGIKFIPAQRTRKFTALMGRATFSESWRNTATG